MYDPTQPTGWAQTALQGRTRGKAVGPDRVARYEKQLTERLDEAGQAVLAKLIESQQEIDSITALENFILGFRLGSRIMAECMDDNDGDIKYGGE